VQLTLRDKQDRRRDVLPVRINK